MIDYDPRRAAKNIGPQCNGFRKPDPGTTCGTTRSDSLVHFDGAAPTAAPGLEQDNRSGKKQATDGLDYSTDHGSGQYDPSSQKPFMTLASREIPDLHWVGAACGTECLPLYRYTGGKRVDNVTDWALAQNSFAGGARR
jgi:Type ISP C-terminal specificity domain